MSVALASSCNSLTGADDVSFVECTPGQFRPCSCSGSNTGRQTCNADGETFSTCSCLAQGVGNSLGTGGGGGTGGGNTSTGGGTSRGGSSGGGSTGGSSETAPRPTQVAAMTGATTSSCPAGSFLQEGACHQDALQIETGFFHDCVLLSDGTVRCWGENENGQLGDGTTEDSGVPVTVPGLSGVQRLALGYNHSCALLDDGSVRCWGNNDVQQLGNGSTVDSSVPVRVSGVTSAIELDAYNDHSCAVLDDGSVSCWGDDAAPAPVNGLASDVLKVSTESSEACAVLANGAVQCWFTANEAAAPIKTGGVVAVRSGTSFSCLILSGGTVQCWGSNTYGQIGNGSMVDLSVSAPTTVAGLSGVTDLALGNVHTCALAAGVVRCWGDGSRNQLGSDVDGSLSPLAVPGLTGVSALASGPFHTCALLDDGSARCWGSDLYSGFGALYGPAPVPPPGW